MTHRNEPIAIIGTACRFPGESSSPSKLWKLLEQPRDVLKKIDRFAAENWHNKNGSHHGASNVLDAYLLTEDPSAFDAQFYNIAPSEAETIDPQQRVLLEVVYEALESAGLTVESLHGSSTAAYVGLMCDDYNSIVYGDPEAIPKYAATGTARSILSNRLSYFFNWTGPSMTIDTACSSSLVAVHHAVQTLRSGTSRTVVAAGSNLIFGPSMFVAESNLSMLSHEGRSRMWDKDANGYARGEGVAAIMMKTLSDAIADGDSIECVIRETGVNTDGRTPGITMPSSSAQAALIRDTYKRAGLDINNPSDRPQYFEAHGTGTKAGDPQEAGAIHRAFFTNENDKNSVLHVGSIKTVIGHTEGTAGLAGVIKASLAIQNKTIPPNLLYNAPNPDVIPYLDHLKIPTAVKSWPEVAPGAPRRASVNSFGFGGANAHAILESFEPAGLTQNPTEGGDAGKACLPFTFSAASEKSLVAQLQSYASYLSDETVDFASMAWTLSHRSAFNFRTTFAASSQKVLVEKLLAAISEKTENDKVIGTRPVAKDKGTGILGIFTGQGAQWPAMGADLITTSPFVARIIDEMERSLLELPAAHRPTWSLKEETLKKGKDSRISESLFSQPLCTAVQVALVNLLREAGISFKAVVGHSSGEIGAAYAAGFLSAWDAIRIAYYRGFYTKLAKGSNGQDGAMLAAGTSMDDATELCELPAFESRLQLAASNSSASVTLSGDADAIDEVQVVLEDETKFARRLKVATAYHSHHMLPCAESYIEALRSCNIQILEPADGAPVWYSSVSGGEKMTTAFTELRDTYWKDNMVQPVLFSQATTEALADIAAPAIAMEVGPHPALKGPASMTIEESLGYSIPYGSTLSRGVNDVEAMASSLGFTWTNYRMGIDFSRYAKSFDVEPHFLKTIPSYTWDHDRMFWFEARSTREQRLRKNPKHELLGVRSSDTTEGEHRWRNFIKPSEVPWMRGHIIQGQMLFPAAGYVVMAVEASKVLASEENVKLVRILDLNIQRAMPFPTDVSIETMFTLSDVQNVNDGSNEMTSARFACNASLNKDGGMLTIATGHVVLDLGKPTTSTLPERPSMQPAMANVDVDTFYESLANTGYNYAELFRGVSSVQRTVDHASGSMMIDAESVQVSNFTIHPAPLDVAFQGLLAAVGAPGDGSLWTLLIPTKIGRITINPANCPPGAGLDAQLDFDAELTALGKKDAEMGGEVNVYNADSQNAMICIEGLRFSPLSQPTAADDKPMFAESIWGLPEPKAEVVFEPRTDTEDESRRYHFGERCCLFYLKQIHEAVSQVERQKCDQHAISVLNWAKNVVEAVSSGTHPVLKKEWLNDTPEFIEQQQKIVLKEDPNLEKIMFVGERLLPFVRGELSMLEEFRESDFLETLYINTGGYSDFNVIVGKVVKQIVHRYPHMNILEIGAGTGSATQGVINAIGHSYASFTFTDISAAFFDKAQQGLFKDHSNSFRYKVLDIEKDVVEQGYPENSYDLVIAANVLHATKSLDHTLTNTRRLLKPGGYLVMLEVTNTDWLRTGFIFSGMPGWWNGVEDGRINGPTVPKSSWDAVFKRNGFSGIDTATPDSKSYMEPYSVMVTQAIDDQINIMRQPLVGGVEVIPPVDNLLIVGPQSMKTWKISQKVSSMMKPYCGSVSFIEKFEDIRSNEINKKQLILSLVELDEAIFKPFTIEKYEALQKLMAEARDVVWVVQGSRGENPYSNMMLGLARCLNSERTGALNIQYLDFDANDEVDTTTITETLLRLHTWDRWKDLSEPYKPLWTFERELFSKQGVIEISRYMQVSSLDERYNSTRRPIRKPIPLDSTIFEMVSTDAKYGVTEYKPPMFESVDVVANSRVSLVVQKSMSTAIKIKDVGFVYLVLGKRETNSDMVLALSVSNRSSVRVPQSWVINTEPAPSELGGRALLATANEIVADGMLSKLNSGSSILVHEASRSLVEALRRLAKNRNISLHLTTSRHDHSKDCTIIDRSVPDRVLRDTVPRNLTMFVNLSSENHSESVGIRLQHLVPPRCKVKDSRAFLASEGSAHEALLNRSVSERLERCYSSSVKTSSAAEKQENIHEFTVAEILEQPVSTDFQIIDWRASKDIAIKLSPSEDHVQFRENKTYFLVGLTGDLGLSLVRWMISRGARYFALSSRNPKVDPEWIKAIEALGATIKIVAMDVTSRASLMQAYQELIESMPAIAGVANGAMILKDGLFETVPYEQFKATLRPKVDGTALLDELFCEDNLDFFMVFSSLTYIIGNVGQSAYAVANSFMASLMEGRRKRGLAGSVINTAGIFGVGYISRMDKSLYDYLSGKGYANISERDFYQFFAEAVLASPHDSGLNFEISNGLKTVDPDKDKSLPAWVEFPRFSNYRRPKSAIVGDSSQSATVSVKNQLKEQLSDEGVHKVLEEGLIAAIHRLMNIPTENSSITSESGLIELGMDSLSAVDMRTWFANEINVDVPVLKLLGGSTIADLVEEVQGQLSPEMIPNLKVDAATTEKTKESVPPMPKAVQEGNAAPKHLALPPLPGNLVTPAGTPFSEVPPSEVSVGGNMESRAETDAGSEITPPSSLESEASDDESEQIAPKPVINIFTKTTRASYGTSSLWFQKQILDDSTSLNAHIRLLIKSNISVDKFESAIEHLGERHEVFRTAFFADPTRFNEPTLGVMPMTRLQLEKRAIKSHQQADAESEAMFKYNFDIANGEVARVILLSLSSSVHYLLLSFDHIAVDAFSFNNFMNELGMLYQGQRLPPIQRQFSDFAAKQREDVESGNMDKELAFWRSEFHTLPEALPLFPTATATSRPKLAQFRQHDSDVTTIDPETLTIITNLCRRHKITRFHFFLAVLKIFLFRMLDTDDLCIGLVDANRTDAANALTFGFLTNLLPLRFARSKGQGFTNVLKECSDKAFNALANSRLPFDVILEKLQVPRSSTHAPLVQMMINYRQVSASGSLVNAEENGKTMLGSTAHDLILNIVQRPDDVQLFFTAQTALYSKEAANIMMSSYLHLVKTVALKSDFQLGKVDLDHVSLYEEKTLEHAMIRGRGESLNVEPNTTASQCIHAVATANPDRVALGDDEGSSLSYRSMMESMDSIVSELVDRGVTPYSTIGILQEPTSTWICSLLAIWKIGAIFVPLDPRNPPSRLAAIVDDSKPHTILCHPPTSRQTSELHREGCQIIDIGAIKPKTQRPSSIGAQASGCAAIMYTSGSTGVPKGVKLSHAAILRSVLAIQQRHGLAAEKFLQQSAYSFDLALTQVLTALVGGGAVHVVSKAKRMDPAELSRLIHTENISATLATPSEYFSWFRHGHASIKNAPAYHVAITAGEALTTQLKNEFRSLEKPSLQLINLYGPVESKSCTSALIDYTSESGDSLITMGTANPGYDLKVVNANLQPVPIGVTGEILIAGPSVALGYNNDEELTRAKFIQQDGHPIFRSGDLGRMQADGSIIYMGRIAGDTQVKVNGIRIDLADVEHAIITSSNGQVLKAVVSLRGSILIVHVELVESIGEDEKQRLLGALTAKLPLPRYMMPSIAMPIGKIPINSHGKVDRRAVSTLPVQQTEQSSNLETRKLTPGEQALRELWLRVIPESLGGAININAYSDFFRVGGDSLQLVNLQALIREELKVAIPMVELFETTSLGQMSAKIASTTTVQEIDWASETALSEDLVAHAPRESVRHGPKTSDLHILVSAGTGYLGSNLLKTLAADERVSRIDVICRTQLKGPKVKPRDILRSSSKISVHTGDLAERNLGLSKATFDRLANETDVILHTGANRSFWDTYEVVRATNFGSTKELTRLASRHAIPLHFISSAGVLELDQGRNNEHSPSTMTHIHPPTDGSKGYLASKWASETYLDHASVQLGLPTSIHRVTAATSTTIPDGLLDEFANLIERMGTLPDRGEWVGKFDLVATEPLCKSICESVITDVTEPRATQQAAYVHHPADVRLSVDDLKFTPEMEEKDRKGELARLPAPIWVGQAKLQGLSWHFASQDLNIGGMELKR